MANSQSDLWSINRWGLPWGSSGLESACQYREHGIKLWSRKIPHAAEQLSHSTTSTKPTCHRYWAHAPQQEALAPRLEKAHAPWRRLSTVRKIKRQYWKGQLKREQKNSQHHNYCSRRDKENIVHLKQKQKVIFKKRNIQRRGKGIYLIAIVKWKIWQQA